MPAQKRQGRNLFNSCVYVYGEIEFGQLYTLFV